MNKNPFLLSIEELKKVSIDYDVSKSSVSPMNCKSIKIGIAEY